MASFKRGKSFRRFREHFKGKQCRVEESPSFGKVKLHLCKAKSYITRQVGDKWKLLLNVEQKPSLDHQHVTTLLYDFVVSNEASIEDLKLLRSTLVIFTVEQEGNME